MKLIFKLALRELKNSKKFVLFFTINLCLGVVGFLTLYSFNQSVNNSISTRAKYLLAADIAISSRQSLKKDQKEKIEKYLDPMIEQKAYVTELYSMVQVQRQASRQQTSQSRLVQIKMIPSNFPLYGSIKLENQSKLSKTLQNFEFKKKAWVSKDLAHQLKLSIGSRLKLGKASFEVSNIIKADSTSSTRGISLAPKLYIHAKYQEELGLISQGSVANYSYLYKLKANSEGKVKPQDIQKEILALLEDNAYKVLLPENSSEQVGRVLNYLSDYLGLVALVAIFLATIGSAFLFQDFIFKRIINIAILKSLGITTKKIILIFITQILILGSLGVSTSGLLAAMFLPIGSSYLSSFLGVPVELSVGLESVLVSLLICILFVLLICFPIIRKLVYKKTANLLDGEKGLTWAFTAKDAPQFIPLVFGVWLLSVWQSQSWAIGSFFALILIFSCLLLFVLIPPFLKVLDKKLIRSLKLKSFGTISMGLGLRFLARDRIASTLTFLSIALGVMLLSIISQLEVSLNSELLGEKVPKPSLFMFDIQADQKSQLEAFSERNRIPLQKLTPMVRARIIKVDGKSFDRLEKTQFQTREEEQRIRFRNRGVNLTYSNKLDSTQKIISGKPFQKVFDGEGEFEISLERRYADRISAGINSQIVFDILGVEFTGRVTSIRQIKWVSFQPNFFITLQEGVVEDAPQTYLGVIDRLTEERQLEVQDLIVEKFPNISMINVSNLLSKISNIFYSMSLAIKAMAYLCLLVGFFVVYGIIQNQIRKKEYDILLMKSFGMTKISIIKTFLVQFLVVGTTATFIGSIFSLVVGNLLSQVFFEGVWSIDWFYFIVIHLVITILIVLLLIVGTIGVYKKPIRSLLE